MQFTYVATTTSAADASVHLSASNSLDGWGSHIVAAGSESAELTVLIPSGLSIIVIVEVSVPAEARVQYQNLTTLSAVVVSDVVVVRAKSSR